ATSKHWRSLRQSLSPLIASGLILPDVGSAWGGAYSPMARTVFTRSALGVTELGILFYAWSSSVDAQSMAMVLRQAGARFAMHLGLGKRSTGVEFVRSDKGQFSIKKGDPRMGFSRQDWSHGAQAGFFYLYKSGRLASHLRRPYDLRLDGVPWTSDLLVDGVPVVAYHEFGENSPAMGGPVTLVLIDPEKLRPHFVPGLLERRIWAVDARSKLVLPSTPRISVSIGNRDKQSPYGLTVERRVWRPAKKGLMSFAVDADGLVRIDRFGEGRITSKIRWSTIVQGPALVSNGQRTPDAIGVTGLPGVAVGLNRGGLLVLAISKEGDRRLMGESLVKAGVVNGLLLGEQSTIDTGVFRSYEERDGQLTMKEGFRPKLLNAITVPGASSALYWTDRWPAHPAGAAATFVRMRVSRP
ncbi:MAG: hypothetical protein VX589_17880, partial [Myxococcota bacterium]|nr:hypothetical protein [Myxococcota bacterium]